MHFLHKFVESAKKALKKPLKIVDGHQGNCKMDTFDGGHKSKMEISKLGLAQSGGIMGAAPNLPYSALLG